jgi:excisionase family DNA binding protein
MTPPHPLSGDTPATLDRRRALDAEAIRAEHVVTTCDRESLGTLEVTLSPEAIDDLAERVAELVAERIGAPDDDRWLTTPEAARHLGLSVDAVHKLTAARKVPFAQDAPGARCYFKRSDLDAWRRSE